MTLGLGNIHALLERLDNPERAFRTVVVAGTNGKGSVTAMAASLLHAQGMRTGRYTSPHVFTVTERIAVDDEPVTVDEMEHAAARIVPLHREIGFSYFEALTAIAFLIFAERGVEVAVLETGLGGRFDATNVTNPLVTVITSISLDHRRVLGATEEEILREKMGILRPGVPLLLGALSPRLREIISERAARDRIPVIGLEELGEATPLGGRRVRIRTPLGDYGAATLPFGGAHQRTNALLAVGAAERVVGGLRDVPAAMDAAYLPGRLEEVAVAGKTFILDVSHNDASLAAAAEALAEISERGRAAAVLGLLRRKELDTAPGRVVASAARVYLVAPDPIAGHEDSGFAPHELYAAHFHRFLNRARARGAAPRSSFPDLPCDAILWNRTDVGDQWDRLLRVLTHPDNPCGTILVAGSHHVVEQFARRLFQLVKG
jgi:dihydrofolate synthase/folylpolyglutamate synthase